MSMQCFELLKRRRQRNLTQIELGALANVHPATISRLELGIMRREGPSASTLKLIADALGDSVEAVFPELLERKAS